MSFENTKQTIFTGTELDYEEIVEIPEGYEKAELRDFEDGTLLRGRPEMSSVTSYTFDNDGEEKTVNRFKLYIFQDDDQLYIEINVNLKTMETFTKTSEKEVYSLTSLLQSLNWKMQEVSVNPISSETSILQNTVNSLTD